MILGYLAAVCLLLGIWFPEVPGAGWLLAAHVAGAALVVLAVRARPTPGSAERLRMVFRYWYPLPYVASCYKVVALLIRWFGESRWTPR